MTSTSNLFVKRIDPHAVLPCRASSGAAGWDLAASEDAWLEPGGHRMVPTGIAITVPPGTYGRIAPRSGLAVKHGVDVLAGVVDRDYRGQVHVVMINHGCDVVHIRRGDRIAQLILERIVDDAEVLEVSELAGSDRGQSGFGSTGR